jgi:hypothetical protein
MMSAPATAMQGEAVGVIVVAVLPAIALLARLSLLRLLLASGDEGGQAVDVARLAAGLLRTLARLLAILMMLVLRLILLMRLMLLMLALLIRPVMIALLVGLTVAGRIRLLLHLARIMRLTTLRLGLVV